MKLEDILRDPLVLRIQDAGRAVEQTIVNEIQRVCGKPVPVKRISEEDSPSEKGSLSIAGEGSRFPQVLKSAGVQLSEKEWVLFFVDKSLGCWLFSSKPNFLYAAFRYVLDFLQGEEIQPGYTWFREISFSKEKSTFDLFLTQYARMIRNFNREDYIAEYARCGFTHIEVNGLTALFPRETGVAGEFYLDFYTYCPALDQFVSSRLNRGLYPEEYLQANCSRLKENAELALKYGLIPGLLCFEPRSVPEALFQKYPTLRGARVDHPFRSLKPRYSLALSHPLVQNHYSELITNLLIQVPELEFMAIWTNDSGAGFEHTQSLYVGRNGGPYLIREWKDEKEIAKAASRNIVNFFRLLHSAASKLNPDFKIITRLEPFYGEREYLWPELKDGIQVEAHSLLTSGWEGAAAHPVYPEIRVSGSALQNTLEKEEKTRLEELRSRKSDAFFIHSFGSHTNHEPLLGIPFPWLAYEKLKSAHLRGVTSLAHLGGIQPPEKVRFPVNQEVFRRFQFDADLDIDETTAAIARGYAGPEQMKDLVEVWRLIDRAVRSSPPLSIYSNYGAVWQRLLVRPLMPDIDRIPEQNRDYYEKFMCTSVHNPNRVDLAKDVLFELVPVDYAKAACERIDANVLPVMERVLDKLGAVLREQSLEEKKNELNVFRDLYDRSRALKCLFLTLRNTAAWIYAVHTFLDKEDPEIQASCRMLLDELIDSEIHNTQEWLDLWENSPVEWMIISGQGETPFIYGPNFGALLKKKIVLMRKHKNDDPYIDPDYMFRVKNNPYEERQDQ